MEKIINSDLHQHKMLAAQAFNEILDGIQRSNLNYQIQVSPFSAFISLKKSLIKDGNGSLLLPPAQPADGTDIVKLENNLAVLKSDYKKAIDELAHTREELRSLDSNRTEVTHQLEIENKALKQETKALAAKLENKALEAKQLRGEIAVLSKDKNTIQVALKSAQHDLKSQSKITEKKIMAYEQKIIIKPKR